MKESTAPSPAPPTPAPAPASWPFSAATCPAKPEAVASNFTTGSLYSTRGAWFISCASCTKAKRALGLPDVEAAAPASFGEGREPSAQAKVLATIKRAVTHRAVAVVLALQGGIVVDGLAGSDSALIPIWSGKAPRPRKATHILARISPPSIFRARVSYVPHQGPNFFTGLST